MHNVCTYVSKLKNINTHNPNIKHINNHNIIIEFNIIYLYSNLKITIDYQIVTIPK